MKLSDIPAAPEGIGAELRLATSRLELRNLLDERDSELRYNVGNDRDDTGLRERVWASECVCSYCRRTGEMTPCGKHRLMAEELEEMES